MTQTHDLVVIGMGVGGEQVAGRAAEAGMGVLGIERALVAGECPYWGCIPSKRLSDGATLVADAERGVLVGGSAMGPAAGEIAGLLVLAIRERIPVAALQELVYPYPTFVRGVEDALRQL
ncbi:MAG TPA: FAD-dependent oxidoreductase [Actinomycetes bacterium]|jgi:pyruvate/2-oxoglutarate dehydrogenase complex dihydrolipoamide dehydrogenase (E3) component|nr:FAD-dependent oxidoreductase [Actinomycetes bacterium]